MGAEGSRLYSPSDESTGYLSSPNTPSPGSYFPGDKFRGLAKATSTTIDISLRSNLDASKISMVGKK